MEASLCPGCGTSGVGTFCVNCGQKKTGGPSAKPVGQTIATYQDVGSGSTGVFLPDSFKCHGCSQAVSGGVEVLGHTYHRECFNCTECKQNLFSKGGYRELGGSAYCGDCANKRQGLINAEKATTRFSAAQQTAKKCRICWKVIEGRFRKCGDFTYHFDCFKCQDCGAAFVNEAFHQAADGKVICPSHVTTAPTATTNSYGDRGSIPKFMTGQANKYQ